MGFGAPLAQWLRGPLRELASDMLLSSGCAQRGWLEPKAVRDLITEHMTGAANHAYRLWAVLMLELWAERCLTPQAARNSFVPIFRRTVGEILMALNLSCLFMPQECRRQSGCTALRPSATT